jgi:uncharacterized protein DUF4394/thrombospondin type 3 repeat protein
MRIRAGLAGVLSVLALLGAMHAPALAEPAAGVMPGNVLVLFDTSSPGAITTRPITGLGANETVRGIDTRPSTGEVFIATVTTGAAANSFITTYRLNTDTGAATLVGATATALAGAGDVPTGWDFNPVADTIRYVNTNDENARISPANGTLAGNDTDLTPAATTTVIAVAYDRNRPGLGTTTQYCVDRNDSQLCIQGGINGSPSPNAGVTTDLAPLGFNLNQANDGGFDVSHNGTAYAALTDAADNLTRLYTITLVTSLSASPVAAPVGFIGNGMTEVRTITLLDVDPDGDGVVSRADNCPSVANSDQANFEGDAEGDACDADDDNDGVPDVAETGFGTNPRSADSDGDGVPDGSDRCPTVAAATADGCPATAPPAFSFTMGGLPRRITLGELRRNGLSFSVAPTVAASFVAELRGTVRGGRLARVGDVVLAERRLRRAAGRRRIRLRVPRSQRRRLRRRARLRVQVTATDALGRAVSRTRSLRIN